MKRLIPPLILVTAATLVLWTLTLPEAPEPARPLPPGWALVRPPHDVGVLLVEKDEVWAGGMDGLWVIDRRALTARSVLTSEDGPPHVRAIVRDRDGTHLIGHDQGITRLVKGRAEPLGEALPLPRGRVLSLLVTRGGMLWVGTEWGAARREGDTWRAFRATDGLASDVVNTMAEDDDGGIWFGSYNIPDGGVTRWHAGSYMRWTPLEGLPHASITSLFRDRDSRIWAGGGLLDRGGLACFEKVAGDWRITRVLSQADGLAGAKVRSLFEDRDGRLWVGSEYEGLAFRDQTGWTVRRAVDGLAHDEVKAIRQDEDGAIWIGTRDGVTVIRQPAK